jgi:hypothetical protein
MEFEYSVFMFVSLDKESYDYGKLQLVKSFISPESAHEWEETRRSSTLVVKRFKRGESPRVINWI